MNSHVVLKARGASPLQLYDPSIICSCYSGTTCFHFPDFVLFDDQSHYFSLIEVFLAMLTEISTRHVYPNRTEGLVGHILK